MTAFLTISPSKTIARSARLLLVGASGLALAAPLAANEVLFTTGGTAPVTGERTDQRSGLTQVLLTGGGTVSIVDAAEYRLNADGSIDLYEGTITVAGVEGREIIVRMPEGLEGRVSGMGSAGNFTARATGEASGHALTGMVRIGRADRLERFAAGQLWRARGSGDVRQVVANAAQVQPDAAARSVVAIGGDAGPVAAALNGIPTGFADQLAAAGASSDIVGAARRVEAAVANPAIAAFPSGDLALLVASAADLESAYGGAPFPGAEADIIRAYLRFLAGGGAGSDFLAAYGGFAASYLDLIRASIVPSGFAGADPADVESYLAFIRRTGAFAELAARDRVLAEAYLTFLASGGDRNRFAVSFTDLTSAYFAFVRGGGDPAAFTGASEAALRQTVAFLLDSGLAGRLTATDRVLAEAFRANGGLAFAAQYQAALGDYFAFIASGRRPSDYAALDQATLRAYLETLDQTGLLVAVLGERAGFYADYLAFLRAGGEADAFAGLPANIFAGYAAQLEAYRAFLAAGNPPSAFTAADPAQLQAFILQLQAAGALERFLGADAAFFAAFADFVRGGGSIDAFAGLNANIFTGYATQLQAYFAFLEAGGVPSTYRPLSQEAIARYLAELQSAGALTRFLPALGDFYAAYFAFVARGGNPDTFTGLPVPPDFGAFAAALNAYADFLAGGGLPADFRGQDLTVLASFIAALADAGELEARLGSNAGLLSAYFAFLRGGGTPNGFAGLPVYADYVTALNAYFAFLSGGGLPGDYTALDQATINAYLAALEGAGGLGAFRDLDSFFTGYFAFVRAGGDPAGFAGLPVFGQYVAALNAYFAFLAGGGLPGDYTALDQATINAYLAALTNAQGGIGAFGDLDAFFAEYAAFVLGGGDPARFAGLPVYADYVAALNAYFAFLANGGRPSDYTALDQATIQAYLVALADAQGGLQGFAGLDSFFVDFFAFIEAGGDPDQFAGLPINGGGGPGAPSPQLAGVNAWVFGTDGLRINTAADVAVDAEGRISSVTLNAAAGNQTFTFDPASASLREFGRIGDAVAWSRYFVGTAANRPNVSEHILVGTPATNLPNAGTVSYRLVGGTAPTDRSSAAGTTGWFTGNLAVAFGTQPLVGLDFEVTSETERYRVATQGGAANPLAGGLAVRADGTFENQNAPLTGLTGTSCTGFCQAQVFGGAFGSGAEAVGFTYNVFDQAAANSIQGVAVFGTQGTALPGLGTAPGTGGGGGTPPVTGTVADFDTSVLVTAALHYGEQGFTRTSRTADSDVSATGVLNRIGSFSRGTATGDQIIGDRYAIIGRWINGTSNLINDRYVSTANDAVHWSIASVGSRDFTLTGRIAYDLLGATTPTYSDGRTAPGSFDGSLVIDWQSAAQIALTLNGRVTMPDAVYAWSFTSPNFATRLQGVFESNATVNGAACANNSCQAAVSYQFGGARAGERFAMNYNIELFAQNLEIGGSALFGAPGTYDPAIFGLAGGGGGGGGGTPPPATGNPVSATVFTDHMVVESGSSDPLDLSTNGGNLGFVGYETNAAGEIVGYRNQVATLADQIGTARNADSGQSASGTLRWTRWTEGTLEQRRLGPVAPIGFSANQGYHAIVGTPATNLPTSGRVNYTLVGGTSPTSRLDLAAPGRLVRGGAAVEFGSTSRVGIELTLEYSGQTFEAATTGGLANVAASELALGQNATFRIIGAYGNVTSSGAFCASTCRALWEGFLAGNGAAEMGLTYSIQARSGGSERVVGAAAFASSGTPPAGGPQARSAVIPAAAGIDMSRWSGTDAPAPQAGAASPGGTGAVPLAPGIAAAPDPQGRQDAIREAERMMGGIISFSPSVTGSR